MRAQRLTNARIALQFVLNYEEGSENCVLHCDAMSEVFLSEIIGAQAFPDRHMSMESLYEYGSRVGAWRILDEFRRHLLDLGVGRGVLHRREEREGLGEAPGRNP